MASAHIQTIDTTTTAPEPAPPAEPLPVTLLELVKAVSECTDDEREVVIVCEHMIRTRSVRLTGCFRDQPF